LGRRRLSGGSYRQATQKIDVLMESLQEAAPFPPLAASAQDGMKVESNLTAAAFKEMVRRAKDYILSGDILQVVLSQRFQVEKTIDPFISTGPSAS